MHLLDIVSHNQLGFGIIVGFDNADGNGENPRVRFTDETLMVPPDSLRIVPSAFVELITTRLFEYSFSNTILRRGMEYYREGRIRQLILTGMPDRLVAFVHGTNDYQVTLFPRGSSFRNHCTCPVTDDCKHSAALCYYLYYQFNRLKAAASEESRREALEKSSPEERFHYVTDGRITNEKLEYGLKELMKLAEEYPEKTAEMLDYFMQSVNLYKHGNRILKAAEKLPEGVAFVSYAANCIKSENTAEFVADPDEEGAISGGSGSDSEKEEASLNGNGPENRAMLPDAGESKTKEKKRASRTAKRTVSGKMLFRYFRTSYSVERDGGSAAVFYFLKSPNDQIVFRVKERKNGTISVLENNSGLVNPEEGARALLLHIQTEQGDAIIREKEELNRIIEKEEEERKRVRLERAIDSLVETERKNRKVLHLDKNKAELTFEFTEFDSDTDHRLRSCYLGLRIGITRKYVVRDLYDFANDFASQETVSYGKELTFTHAIENVKPEQREALKTILIMVNTLEYGYYQRECCLSPEKFSLLIEKLKGNTVSINGEDYSVTLEEKDWQVGVDQNYRLSLKQIPPHTELLLEGNTVYLLDRKQQKLDLIRIRNEELPLLTLALNNKGTSVEPMLERFRDEVYARFRERFILNEAVSERFDLAEIEIDAYFDYEKKCIQLRNKYRKNGSPVSPYTDGFASGALTYPDRRKLDDYQFYLQELGFKTAGSPEEMILKEDADVINFLSMDMSEMKKYANVFLSESIQNKSVAPFRSQTIRIQLKNNIMEAFLEESEYTDGELEKILAAIRSKKKYVLLSKDRIVTLDNPDAAEFGTTVRDLGLDESTLNEPKRISTVRALRAFAHEKGCRIDDYLFRMVEDIRNFKKTKLPVPDVKAELRSYQKEGFRWLKTLENYNMGGILADDMGLGKTLEVITLLKGNPSEKPSVVVCPKSVVYNWVNEFRRFDPDAKAVGIYGLARTRREQIQKAKSEGKICLVTSYDSLKNDLDAYDFPLEYLILDEAQYIKNVKAKKSRSVKQLEAAHRLALTGTPIENNVVDLWSIFDFVLPGYLEELEDFKSAYSRNEDYTEVIARRIAPFILRRVKGDVLKDLPEKYEHVLTAEMVPTQRKLYDAYCMEARKALEEGDGAFAVLPYLMKLRQICDDPACFAENYTGGSGKLNLLSDLIPEYLEKGHRILIFSQFVRAIERLESLLASMKIPFYRLTGDTPASERIRLMDSFNAGGDVSVFLISLKAGGTGLNLTGADTVIHLDPWWNVAAENQAADRAHRIGQKRNVEVIKLICEDTVEEKVIELQNMKKDLIDKLISDNDKSVTGVTLEDIRFILHG